MVKMDLDSRNFGVRIFGFDHFEKSDPGRILGTPANPLPLKIPSKGAVFIGGGQSRPPPPPWGGEFSDEGGIFFGGTEIIYIF